MVHKYSKTDKLITTGENSTFTKEELKNYISRMEKRTGVDLEKAPVTAGNKTHFLKNIKDLYVPRTIKQIPRKIQNAAATIPSWRLYPAVAAAMASRPGNSYTPTTDTVRVRGTGKQKGTLAHELGHWLAYNYPKKTGVDTSETWFKALPWQVREELKATAFARKALSLSEWKNTKGQLKKALTTYLLNDIKHPGFNSEKILKEKGKYNFKDLNKAKTKKEFRDIYRNLLAQAYIKDSKVNPYAYVNKNDTIRLKAPAHEEIANKLIEKIK